MALKLAVIPRGLCQRTCMQKLSVASFHASSGLSCEPKDVKTDREVASSVPEKAKEESRSPLSAKGKKESNAREGTKVNKKEDQNVKKREVKLESADKKKLEIAQKRLQTLLKGFSEVASEKTVEVPRPKEKKPKKKREKVSELEVAASGIADAMGSRADKENVKAELMARVKAAEEGLPAYDKQELLQAITGLKDRVRMEEENKKKEEEAKKKKEAERAAAAELKKKEKKGVEDQATLKRSERQSQQQVARVKLFEAEPLGIFTGKDGIPLIPATALAQSGLTTWNAARERDLKLTVARLPSNGFEEMIQWTEQGKLWKFPIDNEFGLDEEHSVGFHEHIFLEHHLEPWCPKAGPVRHFMELVCVGLSKNPWLTVEEKKRHILWFKDYFAEKVELLRDTNAIDESSAQRLVKPLEALQ